MEIESLLRFNPWWETEKISEDLAKPFKREVFYRILDYIEDRQIIEITGLRRVGKTTLLYQIIQKLLESVRSKSILYFSFDEKSVSIKELIKAYESEVLNKKIEDAGKVYIFLDEIQKCKDWDSQLKIFYDLYPNIKFFISGSASLILDRRVKESLAGRVYSFVVKPLSFLEFLSFKGIKIDSLELQERILATEFFDYLKKGGFIELAFEGDERKVREYAKGILEKIIYKDVPESFSIKDIELLKNLVEMFCRNSGMILNYEKLSRDLKRNKVTLINYVYYLHFSMLIKFVKNIRKSFLASSRKMKKVYVTNTAFIYAYEDPLISFDKFLETYVCNALDLEYYYRNSFEIDFIQKNEEIKAIEVKSSLNESEILQFKERLEALNIKKGLVVTKNEKGSYENIEVKPCYFIR